MTSGAVPLLVRTEQRLRRDRRFAAVLEAVVEAPATSAGAFRHAAAQALNEQRREDAVAAFREGALPTGAVQELLGLRTPQAVHRLRSRGRLIGMPLGNGTWFPAWQLQGGRLRADLPDVLAALGRFSTDAIAADRVMRLGRDELGGRSISEALDDPGAAPVAWAILAELGG